MKLRKEIIIATLFVGTICAGCSANPAEEEKQLPVVTSDPVSGAETDVEDLTETPVPIHVFTQEDMIVTPSVMEYDFATAKEKGTFHEIQGMLPGVSEGTWYIIELDGIEYYYGTYDFSEESMLYGWSIISDRYSLANGIKVGMKRDDILSEYPDMAVMDFDGNYLLQEVTRHQGWNNTAYPGGFEAQFDYIMIADINLGSNDTLPMYVGLLMKEDVVAAITFYYPTAG